MNRKFYKIIFVFLLATLTFCCVFLTSCAKKDGLTKSVSELRDNVYAGSSDSFTLSAVSGYKEKPYLRDGKVGLICPYVTFKIDSETINNATYTLTLNYQEKEYVEEFKLNPISSKLMVTLNIENFIPTTFDVMVNVGSVREVITMNSLISPNTLSYQSALQSLEKLQENYLHTLTDTDGNYQFELSVKLMFKNEKPYWYIAIITGEEKVKALLIDGTSGELLAIREVF